MDVTLRYFDGCRSWQTADLRLREALDATGHLDVAINHQRVTTPEEADRLGFVGSPTFLVGGRDVFRTPTAPVGLSCRLYPTPEGLRGSPTTEQLRAALR